MKLIIATKNPHKVREILAIFSIPGVDILSMHDIPNLPDVVEDGSTFEENAIKKAVAVARHTGCWALADDSGLEVDALAGAPGVHSARYAGEPPNYAANNAKLLKELEGVTDRRARFRCVIALASPSGQARTVEGRCEGHITREPRGTGGFGYDPVFVPDGYDVTFAEMSADQKNAISHRGRALREAQLAWAEFLRGQPSDWP